MNKILLLLLLVAVVAMAAWAINKNNDEGFKTVDTEEFGRFIADTAAVQLLDVRTAEEYAQGHIAGAKLIDVKDSTFISQAISQLSKELPVAVYCRSGRRSANAARQLVKAGFEVVNLGGGILAWEEASRPIKN